MITLYDLAGGDSCRFSPNCWRTQMALAHKGLAYQTKAVKFTEIATIGDGSFKTVPVIQDGARFIGDSWAIANYLEDTYKDRPSLFGGEGGRAFSLFIQNWAIDTLHKNAIGFIILDIHDQLDEADKPYFRTSREKRFGKTLETMQTGREGRIADFRASLMPLRMTLASQNFLGGSSPLYPDYLVFGVFQWARLVSDFALLEKDDAIHGWFERMLDLHGGLGRKAPRAA